MPSPSMRSSAIIMREMRNSPSSSSSVGSCSVAVVVGGVDNTMMRMRTIGIKSNYSSSNHLMTRRIKSNNTINLSCSTSSLLSFLFGRRLQGWSYRSSSSYQQQQQYGLFLQAYQGGFQITTMQRRGYCSSSSSGSNKGEGGGDLVAKKNEHENEHERGSVPLLRRFQGCHGVGRPTEGGSSEDPHYRRS